MDEIVKHSDVYRIMIALVAFVLLFLTIYIVSRYIFKRLKKHVAKTPGKLDDFILELFRIPALWLVFWLLFKVFSIVSLDKFSFSGAITHVNDIFLIITVAWILSKFIKAGTYYLQNKLDINQKDNLNARKSLTQIKSFSRIANTIIVIVAISVSLLTFSQARTIGLSLLTSAGIFGIIVGFAAQKSLGMILAGIQIAITQPIRLDDVVIVEGEWGRIEEITLTYVVVKIWDERRLVLPVNYFLEKPFQNWTRSNADIIGSIFLYVDYSFPVDSLREILPAMLEGNTDWDKRVLNVQVTNTTEFHKEVRVLLSSPDASKNWDLRTFVREKIIDFVCSSYPESFAKIRVENTC
ncbi:MAG: mechanosensitive ion channel [Bacteroidales bacterium]|nr:mechanosensitive ion channel [Bacteroidales bacterium]